MTAKVIGNVTFPPTTCGGGQSCGVSVITSGGIPLFSKHIQYQARLRGG